ncbi:hypothetical protein K5D32_02515 [Pseudomonas cichorii]|uniref:hypothetical protein n=1 Tax=Pseudomonas cichorii TaxID=36746 RepID=UPI001C890492|nr:hypothetical protein [Pseudomonas cichorii]MBX8528516.1 hypothetical protein [Pseudomonas cichorii]
MSDLEHYQDSYQGMQSVRRAEQRFDQHGNPVRPTEDFCHNYDTPADIQARHKKEAAYRKGLAIRIGAAIAKMEKICPPKETEVQHDHAARSVDH